MIDIAGNALAFMIALGIIIFVHEAGHLIVAKAFGMKVLAFSLGFGKRLFGFRRGETEYKVALIPLGGYVQLGGEDPSEVSDDPREFLNRPRWQRVLVFLAGPAMNVILAILLIAIVFMAGIEISALPNNPPIVGTVIEGSPGEEAGLLPGDEILSLSGKKISRWDEIQFAILTSPETAIRMLVERDGDERQVVLTPSRVPKYEFGDAGIFPKMLPRVSEVLVDSPAEAAGFATGDQMRALNGRPLLSGEEFVSLIEKNAGQEVVVEVLRDDRPIDLLVTPRDEGGVGRIGVRLGYFQKFGPARALVESVRFNMQITRQTFMVLGKILSGQLAAKSALSGPIEIAALSGAAARSGLKDLIRLMGLLSISIAILNLLPIPVLDGGQIFILAIESTRRRDLSFKVKERINQVGTLMIIALMVMVLYFDLSKNIPAGLLPGS
ncbi:MAG: RIP metalloprotease RseP [Thermoanaerobaculia bacterium]